MSAAKEFSHIEVSVPEILIEEILLNENNPFKKTIHWMRLLCKLCGQIVLGKGVSNEKEWNKVRKHLKTHGEDPGEGIPIRLLSPPLRRRWIRARIKEYRKKETTK